MSASRSRAESSLLPTDVLRAVEDLPLEIRRVDVVEIDQAERADARRREVQGGRGPKAAGADQEHAGATQGALAIDADLGKDEVAAVADVLVRREVAGAAFGKCGGRHVSLLPRPARPRAHHRVARAHRTRR